MRLFLNTIRKILLFSILLNGWLASAQKNSGGYVLEQIGPTETNSTKAHTINRQLMMSPWIGQRSKQKQAGDLGLKFEPIDDDNVYLLYRYELVNQRSKAEVGFSVNHFNVLSLKFTQLFSLSKLSKKPSLCSR